MAEVHGFEHFAEFYTDYGVALQKRFFGHFLKGEDTGWDRQPPVHLNVRRVDGGFELRAEQEWPLARTRWTELHLHPRGLNLAEEVPAESAAVEFEALGGARTHNTTSGNAHYLASDEDDAIAYVQELLGYLPSNNLSEPPRLPAEEETGAVEILL